MAALALRFMLCRIAIRVLVYNRRSRFDREHLGPRLRGDDVKGGAEPIRPLITVRVAPHNRVSENNQLITYYASRHDYS
jgi:hypothetical protein